MPKAKIGGRKRRQQSGEYADRRDYQICGEQNKRAGHAEQRRKNAGAEDTSGFVGQAHQNGGQGSAWFAATGSSAMFRARFMASVIAR